MNDRQKDDPIEQNLVQSTLIPLREGYIKKAEVAQLLGVTIRTVDNLMQRGHLVYFKICTHKNMAFELSQLVRRVNEARRHHNEPATFIWKHNALRHSFISYRVAQIQNVAQVALEAGNSPQVIFQNYRELVRPADAAKWFNIFPKPNVVRLGGAA